MAREASSDSPAISSQSEEAKHAEYVLYIDADMLLRLPGYRWEMGPLDPRQVAGAPMARSRHFWLGFRL